MQGQVIKAQQGASQGASVADYIKVSSNISPILSYDGRYLAWCSDRGGLYQLYTQDLHSEGSARQLTELDESITKISFRPESHDIVFLTDFGGNENLQLWLYEADKDKIKQLTDAPTVRHDWGCWSSDGLTLAYTANSRDKSAMDVYILHLESGESRCIYQGQGYRNAIGFIEDNKALLILDESSSHFDQHLYRLDIATGSYQPFLPHQGQARYMAVRNLKDGSGCLMISDQNDDFFSLCFKPSGTDALEQFPKSVKRLRHKNCGKNKKLEHSAEPSEAKNALETILTAPPREVELYSFSTKMGKLAWSMNIQGWSRLFIASFQGGKIGNDTIEIKLPYQGVLSSLDWVGGEQNKLILSLQTSTTPPTIWFYDLATGEFSEQAGVENNHLPTAIKPMVIHIASFDKLEVPVHIYMPQTVMPKAGFPAIILIHGGPESQWRPTFRADVQYYLALGIAVIAPNVRGSTGYGRRYAQLDDRHLRLDSVRDLIEVRQAIATWSQIDATRIGIMGQSYGGFMVLAALTRYPKLWKAGVEFYGIAHFPSWLRTTAPWRRRLREAEYGDMATMARELEEFSPLNKIEQITAPLLVVQGLEDVRIAPSESEAVYACLRGLGKEVDYLRIPYEGHGFLRQHNRMRVFAKVSEFWQRHL